MPFFKRERCGISPLRFVRHRQLAQKLSEEESNALAVIPDRKVVCPRCGQTKGVGDGGLKSFNQTHLGSRDCTSYVDKHRPKTDTPVANRFVTFLQNGPSIPTKVPPQAPSPPPLLPESIASEAHARLPGTLRESTPALDPSRISPNPGMSTNEYRLLYHHAAMNNRTPALNAASARSIALPPSKRFAWALVELLDKAINTLPGAIPIAREGDVLFNLAQRSKAVEEEEAEA